MSKWDTQSEDDDTIVKVSGNAAEKTQTDFLIIDKNDGGNHAHVEIDDNGNMTYSRDLSDD